jgi:glycosyltransferase involved in cell wall biosynthesis
MIGRKSVLLVSRSLTPPWDEASKNFARVLALRNEASDMAVLTDGVTDEFPARVTQLPIYSKATLDWGQRLRLLKLRRLRKRFDVIHYLFTPTRLNSTMFRTLLGGGRAKSIQTIASLNGREYTREEIGRLVFADQVITYSDFSRRKLERLGVKNVETIQPGIDLALFSKRARDREMAERFEITDADFVTMYPGEYTRLGATDTLVAVLPDLVAALPNLKLVFGCRVKTTADLEKKRDVVATIEAMGLGARVVFTDTIRDMPALYNLADVVLFPVENMVGKFDVPLAVVEAMACEKPVIVSDLAVLQEFLSEETAVTVTPGDRVELVAKLVELHADPARRAAIGRSARAYTETWFDIDRVAARYEDVYQRLVERTAQ